MKAAVGRVTMHQNQQVAGEGNIGTETSARAHRKPPRLPCTKTSKHPVATHKDEKTHPVAIHKDEQTSGCHAQKRANVPSTCTRAIKAFSYDSWNTAVDFDPPEATTATVTGCSEYLQIKRKMY
jgi:hypothetical protein